MPRREIEFSRPRGSQPLWRKRGHPVASFRKRLPVQLVWRRSERQQTTARHWPLASLGRRRIKTATFNLGDLAEADRTCATGAPYCLPFVSLICVPSRGAVVGIEWGNRCGGAIEIEDLANKLRCRRADRDFVCRESSDRGIAPERRNAECESYRCIQRHPAECDEGPDKHQRSVAGPGHRGEIRHKTIG